MPDDQDIHPPLQRHPALHPLSREHMGGLIQARKLSRAADATARERRAAIDEFLKQWDSEIEDHFEDEERLLLPLTDCPTTRQRLLFEHGTIRSLAERCRRDPRGVAGEPGTVGLLGRLLRDHIRWEEREYFERIQRDHPDALARMSAEADTIEQRRPGSRARTSLDTPWPAGKKEDDQ